MVASKINVLDPELVLPSKFPPGTVDTNSAPSSCKNSQTKRKTTKHCNIKKRQSQEVTYPQARRPISTLSFSHTHTETQTKNNRTGGWERYTKSPNASSSNPNLITSSSTSSISISASKFLLCLLILTSCALGGGGKNGNGSAAVPVVLFTDGARRRPLFYIPPSQISWQHLPLPPPPSQRGMGNLHRSLC